MDFFTRIIHGIGHGMCLLCVFLLTAMMTLTCADPECGAKMDASFEIGQIPVEAGHVAASYCLTGTDLVFRLPKGSDQEEADAAGLGPEAGVRRTLERCILEPGGTFHIRGKEPALPLRQHGELMGRLAQLSAQIEGLKKENR